GVDAAAHPARTRGGRGTGIAVVAGADLARRRVRARPRGGITGAGGLTLVGSGAGDGVAARAHAALAGVGLRAPIAVVADAAVGLRRAPARPRAGVPGAGGVTLVVGGAADGVAAAAEA